MPDEILKKPLPDLDLIKYPQGLDQAGFVELVKKVLDGIDSERLFQDQRRMRVRHPLLKERIGKDVAVNMEIYNLMNAVISGKTIAPSDENIELIEGGKIAEEILLDAAKDRELFGTDLANLTTNAQNINSENPEDDVIATELVATVIRKELKMANMAQDLILYGAVTRDVLEEPAEAILKVMETAKADFLTFIEGQSGEDVERFQREVMDEVDAIKAWFKI